MSQTPTTPISPTFFNNGNGTFQEGLISTALKEEISTIFVVGFPEDMQEREFQNMFMFSPGFEAATLKVPTKDSTEEDVGNRKQIIGFAKFRTRKEAMDARDILNGRKVDADKGCVLKAEMAKKNLHTKRGLLNEQKLDQPQSPTSFQFPNHSTFEAFHSVPPIMSPNELRSPNEYYSDFFSNPGLMSPPPPHTSVSQNFITRSQSVDARSMDLFIKPSVSSNRFNSITTTPTTNGRFSPNNNFYDELDYLSKSTPTTELTFRAMNSLLLRNNHNSKNTNSITSPPSSKSTGLSKVMEENSNLYNQQQHPHEPRFHPSLSTPPKSSSITPPPGIISPTTSYRSFNGFVGSSNPADQNPPCNTLYVGNLPSNTNEDELVAMFSKCPGYKRLSFKNNKSNGPMCFVEFDDTMYAAQALQELHGNPLSNSVKGGIRLSFSKNPLGVRQNSTNNTNNTNGGFPLMNAFTRRESITATNFDSKLF